MALANTSTPKNTISAADDEWTITLDVDNLWRGALLFIASFVSHWTAIGGGFIWDDDAHVTRIDLRSLEGLWNIWFKLGATQQYYPLLHSIFWFEHALWGDSSICYHIANILLHTIACFLLVALLKRLAIPGAWLAGFVFALHPVYVESVAWITEEKNTISAIFYLLAAIYYFKYSEERTSKNYWTALCMFILALLSKTVTATLPAAILVIMWWKNGKLEWKKDVLPLIPWFILGAIGGMFTAWVERVYIGAQGSDFNLSILQRILLAGHVVLFYAGKLLLPVNLIFIYQHWTLETADIVNYIYPILALSIIALLAWFAFKKLKEGNNGKFARAPLAGYLFFVGTLFPVLGFANVYPFMFSYVADHFQYLASLGIIVPLCAAITILMDKISAEYKPTASAIGGVLLALLGVAAYFQSQIYTSAEVLYRDTITKNPNCWMAHNNLGAILLNSGKIDEAKAQFIEAITIRPPYADAQSNLCNVYIHEGHNSEAIDHGLYALKLRPNSPDTENNVAIAYANMGRIQEAIQHYKIALAYRPNYPEVYNNLGNALVSINQKNDAITCFQNAAKLRPSYADAYSNMGLVYFGMGKYQEAINSDIQAVNIVPNSIVYRSNLAMHFSAVGHQVEAAAQLEEALKVNPNVPDLWYNLGNDLVASGKYSEAVQPFVNTIKLNPNNIGAYNNLGAVLFKLGKNQDAIAQYQAVIKLKPDYAEAHSNLGVALSAIGKNQEAINEYGIALKILPTYADCYNNLGLALLAIGKVDQAIPNFKKAIQINPTGPSYKDNLDRALKATKLTK